MKYLILLLFPLTVYASDFSIKLYKDNLINMPERYYFQFKGSDAFPQNAIFERDENNNFSPIMGSWNEENFKQRSGGKSFKDVKKLETTFEEVMKYNPFFKQQGVILPDNANYEIHGNANNQHFEKITDLMSKIKANKKYKFVVSDDFSNDLQGKQIILNSSTDEKYKQFKEKTQAKTGGSTGEYKDYYEVRINPKMPNLLWQHSLAHEIAHTLFDKTKTPDNLFKTNKTSNSGGTYINQQETIADHFANYINFKDIYKQGYPEEVKFFDNFLNK